MAGLAQMSEFFANPLFTEVIKEVPVKQEYIGQRFLPIEETFDISFNETVFTKQADMADIVNALAELPLTDRDPVRRVSGEITDIGQSYIITKQELMALMDKGNDAKRKLAEKQLLRKTATIKGNIDARIEWLRWQALGKGAMVYNKAGIIMGVDFEVPAGNKQPMGTRWDGVSPTIIADYEGMVQDYVDLNGVGPDVFVTSIKAIRTIMNNADVRKAVTGLSDKLVTLAELNDFLVGRQMAKLEAYDATVAYRDVDNGGVRVASRLLDEKTGVFLKEGGEIGSQLLGPTYENEMRPGIFARSFTQERPTREIIEVVAASFPKILDPNLILIATILT